MYFQSAVSDGISAVGASLGVSMSIIVSQKLFLVEIERYLTYISELLRIFFWRMPIWCDFEEADGKHEFCMKL